VDDHLWGQIGIQVLLILLNAFFASAEIAVLSLNESKIRKRAEDGDRKAIRMLGMIREPSGFLSTIQIGITLAGFLGSAFAADNFAGRLSLWLSGLTGLPQSKFHTAAVIVITLILSYFTLVLGELVPKRIAMKRSEAVAGFASGVIHGLSKIMKPIVAFLSLSTNAVLRLFRISPEEEEEQITEEDLLMMVDISEEHGNIETGERELIQNIFHFNNITAEDVMTHRTRISAVPLGADDDEVMELIVSSGYSRLPVYDGKIDRIVGILSTRSFLLDRRKEVHTPVAELMMPCYYVPESVRADQLFRDMQERSTHMAVVLDSFGGTSGIVTMEDLLEEIVGEIYDEFDDDPDDAPETDGQHSNDK
jgi:putative hemolysin